MQRPLTRADFEYAPAAPDVQAIEQGMGRRIPETSLLTKPDTQPLASVPGLEVQPEPPAREHTPITDGNQTLGEITSGGFGPTVGGPIAMGYVAASHAAPETAISLVVRGTPRPARIVKMPFVATRYYRGK